ncbi:MAG: DUF928 domain-containing protein [Acaryochloridaceae cyanobacterium RL_2_7]|nr:DUF928 domain-containing protein [Acaryochloridaceae cyanobacterium RL_2_7]
MMLTSIGPRISQALPQWIGVSVLLLSSALVDRAVAFPEFQSAQAKTQAKTESSQEDWGRPKRRTSGGDRNLCQAPLVALIPGQGNVGIDEGSCGLFSQASHSLTAMRSPIVWVYIPPSPLANLEGELVLLEDRQPIHRQILSIPATGGLFPVQFDYPLNAETIYDWQFSLLFDPDHPTENPTVENTIQYAPYAVDLLPQSALRRQPIAQAKFQAQQNRWQDALHTVAQNYCLNPNVIEAKESWVEILKQVQLSGLSGASFLRCQQGVSSSKSSQTDLHSDSLGMAH